MRALSLVEVAGIPVMHSLYKHTDHIQKTLGICHKGSDSRMDSMRHMGKTSRHFLQCFGQLFADWLTNGDKLPPTWRSLLQVIRQLSLDDLAYQVETYLRTGKTGRVKHQPKGAEGKTDMELEGEFVYKFIIKHN